MNEARAVSQRSHVENIGERLAEIGERRSCAQRHVPAHARARHQRLSDENRSLRQQQEQLVGERSQLLAKNEQARSRVEAMISRLKSLEQHT